MTERLRRAARALATPLLVFLGAFAAAAQAAAADDPIASVPPQLLEALQASGLIGTAEPVRPFTWTLVMTRPLRAPRHRRETYAGTPPGALPGLSPMMREELTEEGRTKRTVHGVSVRGLMFVKAGETKLDVRVHGLRMPLTQGQRFRIEYDDDNGELLEDCRIGGEVPAAIVHASIPGLATRIDCAGSGRYKRIGVQVSATVMYLHEAGVFVGVEQAIDSPFGPIRSEVRIVSFAMGER